MRHRLVSMLTIAIALLCAFAGVSAVASEKGVRVTLTTKWTVRTQSTSFRVSTPSSDPVFPDRA